MSKQTEQPGPNITLLKWIVGILGVLIVIFTAVIAVTIFQRLTATGSVEKDGKTATTEAMAAPPVLKSDAATKLPRFGDIRLPVPDDMDVIDMTASSDRLFLTLGTEGAARLVLVIDLSDGRVLGSINLEKNGIQQ
ncbi:MAG: hypothetical protein EP348_01045 [Alphaproteobacteria bacterium]|nr:MAG: hypothetical protein EP348_01045 [Alphaproteobacteria bacterium]